MSYGQEYQYDEYDTEPERVPFSQRIFGNRDRVGWWAIPVFIATALGGAVMAGALATVYYGQQVGQLEAETRDTRAQLQQVSEDVETAGQEALAAISLQVDAVRESLDRELPVPDALAIGIVHVRAVAQFPAPTTPEPEPEPSAEPEPSPDPSPQVSPASFAQQPAAQAGRTEIRQASGLAVARAGADTYVVTSYAAVADPQAPGRALDTVEMTTRTGTFTARAHSWDVDLDLAMYRVAAGEVPIPVWRPSDEPLVDGARLVSVGVTPTRATLRLTATIGALEPRTIVTDVVSVDLLRGGALVDVDGRVVGITSFAYNPYGAGAGDVSASIPIRVLCEGLLRCGSDDVEDAQPG